MIADIIQIVCDNWQISLSLIIIFTFFELIFSVSLILIEDYEELDLDASIDKLKDTDITILKKFLLNKKKYESRFHCALILANLLMFLPLTVSVMYLVKFIMGYFTFIGNESTFIVITYILEALIILIIILMNYCFFFSLPRKIIKFSPSDKKSRLTIISIKYSLLMIPIADLSELLINIFFKLIGNSKYNDSDEVTEEDIKSLVNESQDMGVLDKDEAEMINNIFELDDKEAKDIMTNRNSIVAINADTSLPDAIKMMIEGNNSRYPVYIDNLDHIIGLLNLRDALRYINENPSRTGAVKRYPKLLREARFVSETRKIGDLFNKMQADKLQVVIVIDEYGQTSGIVSMEDIVEEIVGNILDEFDEEETFIESKGEKTFEIDGLTPLEDLEDKFDINFDVEDIETLSGFLITKIGKIPLNNEEYVIEYNNFRFKTLQIDNHIIKNVLLEIIETDNGTEAELNAQNIENQTEKC